MSIVPTLRTITLTDLEAEVVYEILAASIQETHTGMTDAELVRAIELRDRFNQENPS
jgi:hypothetical protein